MTLHTRHPTRLPGSRPRRERHSCSDGDSLIVAAALYAGCATLCSEDMQHGKGIDGRLTIRNPFVGSP